MIAAVTIVAKNYLAQAAILERSFLLHHPEAEFFTVLVDGTNESKSATSTQGTVLVPADLDIDSEILERMATIYDVMEFATAIKPKALEFVLKATGKNAAYIDPDIEIFHSLDIVVEGLETHAIVLTPHNIFPIPRDGMETSEQAIRYSGIYNLGFVAVSHAAFTFLDWWHERLVADAIVDLENALFTDQRWVDFAPALFDVKILKDPGLNVAYWNIHERELTRNSRGEILANSEMLYFYHFSGYDPTTPWVLTKHDGGRPRFSFEKSPILRELFDGYGRQLASNNFAFLRKTPYGLNTSIDGFPLTKEVRRSYRNWWLSAIEKKDVWPPSAFSKRENFSEWMTDLCLGALHSPHSRAERVLWESSSYLQGLFPDVDATSSAPYRGWLDGSAEREKLFSQITHLNNTVAGEIDRAPYGWNLLSAAVTEIEPLATSERCELLIQACGLPVQKVKIRESTAAGQYEHRPTADAFPVHEDLIAIDFCGEAGRLIDQGGFTRRPQRQRILMNMWDFDRVTSEMEATYSRFDQIWCPSEFVAQSLPDSIRAKAVNMNIPLEDPANYSGYTKSMTGISGEFIFLSVFDAGSFANRDNPVAVLEAYLRAFDIAAGARLVIRIVNSSQSSRLISRMRYLAQARSDVTFLEGKAQQGEILGLVNATDCFVSMHRTTAFGLNMARAVVAGKPVIATGYSGNLAYLGDLGLRVQYSLESVGKSDPIAPENAKWALADAGDAAIKMREVFNHYSEHSDAAKNWSTKIRNKYLLTESAQTVRSSILGI